MKTFEKTIIVTEQEWQERRKAVWQRELESWTRSRAVDPDYEGDPALEDFFWSGNIERFIHAKVKQGDMPGRFWGWVLKAEPTRNYEALVRSIRIFWEWVLEDPSERLPNNSRSEKMPAQELFEKPIQRLGSVNTPILDPICSARLFKECYGETFQAETVFPYPLGKEGWQPVLRSDPEDRFWKLQSSLSDYLFKEKQDIKVRQSPALVEHWFSTIPLLTDHRMYHTFLYEDEDHPSYEKNLVNKQWTIRSFLANLYDYNVWYEDGIESVTHNDPELENYIKDRLNAMEMPDEYHQLLEFIHKHKEDCVFESE